MGSTLITKQSTNRKKYLLWKNIKTKYFDLKMEDQNHRDLKLKEKQNCKLKLWALIKWSKIQLI